MILCPIIAFILFLLISYLFFPISFAILASYWAQPFTKSVNFLVLFDNTGLSNKAHLRKKQCIQNYTAFVKADIVGSMKLISKSKYLFNKVLLDVFIVLLHYFDKWCFGFHLSLLKFINHSKYLISTSVNLLIIETVDFCQS